ncbi:MAG: efflux RND transporter periplasmic adaptor subunit [Phycisphaerae bacterium]
MKFKHPKHTVIFAVVTALIVLTLMIWRIWTRTTNDFAEQPLQVTAQVIGSAVLEETIPITGTFVPFVTVDIVPEVSGRLEQLRLEDGTLLDVGVAVKQGEVIAIINRDFYLAQFAQAQAAVLSAQVALADAEREKNRMISLFEAGSSTEQAKDKAVTAADLAAAQLKQAQAAFDMAKVTLDRAAIKSPIDGVVAQKYIDEGNMAGPSTPLVRIVQTDTLKVTGGVSERYLPTLVPGETPVRIKTDAYPQDDFEGVVHKVAVTVDTVTRTAEVEIRVPNKEDKLKPGMFARMTIVVGRKECVVVPDSALIREVGQMYVVVVEDNIARRRGVKLGIWQGDFHEVLTGISIGDVVVTRGQTILRDGQKIEVIQEAVQ